MSLELCGVYARAYTFVGNGLQFNARSEHLLLGKSTTRWSAIEIRRKSDRRMSIILVIKILKSIIRQLFKKNGRIQSILT